MTSLSPGLYENSMKGPDDTISDGEFIAVCVDHACWSEPSSTAFCSLCFGRISMNPMSFRNGAYTLFVLNSTVCLSIFLYLIGSPPIVYCPA